MSKFANYLSENLDRTTVETPRADFGARLQQDIMQQREQERRRVAAVVAGQQPPNMADMKFTQEANAELGLNLPTPPTPETRTMIEQQMAASRLIKAFEDAPLTTQWASSLENAQLIRNSAEAMAQAERIFAAPPTVVGQIGEAGRGVGRAFFPTLGSGPKGLALATETAERSDLQAQLPNLQQQLRQGAASIEMASREDADEHEAEVARATIARELRHTATISMTGEDSRNAVFDVAARIEAGEDPLTLLDELSDIEGGITPSPDRPMYQLGETIGNVFRDRLAAPRGYEELFSTQFGEAIGSFGAFMATSALTGPTGSFMLAGAAGIDEQYNRAIQAGLSHEEAMTYAIQGAPAGVIQALSVEFAMRRLPIPAQRRFGAVVKDLVATGLAETTVETAGAIMQNITEQQYNEERGTFDDTFVAGIISGSAAATLRAVALGAVPGVRRSIFKDIERAEASAEFETTMDALRQGLEGNELREAVPDRFRSWAETVAEGNPDRDTVYISPQGLQELAQSAANPAILEQVIAALPGVTQADFDAAVQQGTDLAIPMATWMTDVAGTEFDMMLAEHMRFDPNNMTTFERVRDAKAMAQEMRELSARVATLEQENVEAETTPLERARLSIYNDARAKIAQAGFTARAADAYAAQYSAFMARTAERSNLTLDEFLARYPAADINIDGQVIEMRGPDEQATLENVLEEIRVAEDGVDLTPEAEEVRADLETLGIDPRTLTDEQIRERLRVAMAAPQETGAAPEADVTRGSPPQTLTPAQRQSGTLAQLLSSSSSIVNQDQFASRVGPNNEGPWFGARPTTTPDGSQQFYQPAADGSGVGFAFEGPTPQDMATIRPEVVFGTELEGDGLKFANFFADVTEGTRQRPTRLVEGEVEYQGVITLTPEVAEFQATREKYTGNFDQHIQTSIPGFYEIQAIVGDALAKAYNRAGVQMLDIGASEGALMKAVVERSEGSIFATALDPNPSMRDTFERMGGPKRVSFELAAFGSRDQEGQEAWTEDHKGETVSVPFYKPTGPKFDVVHEAMVFQFISNGRGAQVARVKELMKPNGIAIFEQKFGGPADQYNANEAKKDDYKAQYYTEDQLAAKRAEVLQTGGDAVEGMTDLQASQAEFEAVLKLHFKHAFQFWSSGNFKGYIAGDSLAEVQRVLDNMQSTQSEYSVEATPREVTAQVDPRSQTVSVETAPAATTAVEGRPQLPVRADGMVELHHWSGKRLDVVDPQFAGTGPYSSRERRAGTKLSFYGIAPRKTRQEAGTGYVKEPNLGGIHHVVAVDPQKVYPYFEDPDGLMAGVRAATEGRRGVSENQRVNMYEQAIRDAGYLGYYVTEDGSGRAPLGNVAVVFEALQPETAYSEDSGQVFYQGETDWYYSALTNSVENAKQAKATAKDWKAIIPKMPGVKKAEIDWSGVMEWLDTQEGQLTREEVARYLRSQEIELVTTIGTEGGADWGEVSPNDVDMEMIEPDSSYIEEIARDHYYDSELENLVDEASSNRTGWHSTWDAGDDARHAYLEEIDADDQAAIDEADDFGWESAAEEALRAKVMGKEPDSSTSMLAAVAAEIENRWSRFEAEAQERAEKLAESAEREDPEYSLTLTVGGTTYTATQTRDGEVIDEDGSWHSGIDEWISGLRDSEETGEDPGVRWGQYTERGGEQYREITLTVPNLEETGPNQGRRVYGFVEDAHFAQPNIVVHARVKARRGHGPTNQAGVLFVEEIQSDLGTDWREAGGQPAGFRGEATPGMLRAMREADSALTAAREEHSARIAAVHRTRDALTDALYRDREAGTSRNPLLLRHAAAAFARGVSGEVVAREAAYVPDDIPLSQGQQNLAAAVDQLIEGARGDTASADALLAHNEAVVMAERAQEAQDLAFIAHRDARDAVGEATQGVVDLPFTPFDGQIAYEVMLKRLLNLAAQEGRDALAWTPGYMQAERWSGQVQNVVRRIDWSSEVGGGSVPTTLRGVRLKIEAAFDPRAGVLTRALPEGVDPNAVLDDYLRQVESVEEIQDGPLLELGSLAIEHSNQLRDIELAYTEEMRALRRLTLEARGVVAPQTASGRAHRKVVLDGANGADTFVLDENGVIVEKTSGRIPASDVVGKNMSELIGGPMTRAILENESGSQGNQNIVIGGDGYKIAYDQQMKKFVEKWAKKHGGKVRTETLPDFISTGRVKENINKLTFEQLEQVYEVIYPEPAEYQRAMQIMYDDMMRGIERARGEAQRNYDVLDRNITALDEVSDQIGRSEALRVLGARRGLLGDYVATNIASALEADGTDPHNAAGAFIAGHRDALVRQRAERQRELDALADPNNPADVQRVLRDVYARRVPVDGNMRGRSLMQRRGDLPADLEQIIFEGAGRQVWYIEITDEMRAAAQQPQPLFQNNRGKIVLPPRYQRPTITLFEGADLSTLLHEMGHQYLYILQDLASTGDMGDAQRADWETIQRWWRSNAAGVAKDAGNGVTEADVIRYLDDGSTGDHALDNAINVGLHEQWARSFEGYLLEGKSPSLSLTEAFRSFKAWLIAIYRRAEALNVDISPEMRDVFDRMFATEEEISFARETEAVDSLVADSADALGISEEDYRRLVDLHDEAREEAEQRLTAHIMEPIRHQQREDYKRERAAVEEEKRAEIIRKPAHRVREWIGNRRWLDGDAPEGLPTDLRLDRGQLVSRYGDAILRLLPRGRFPLYNKADTTGHDIDEVAGWFGFSSGDAMVQELQRTPSIDAEVKAEVDAEMQRRYPDPAKDDSVEAAAVEALHGDKAGQLLVAELRALSKLKGVKGRPTPRQQAREVARRTLGGMVARKAIKSHTWQAAERKAAKDAQEALAKGDRQGAFDAKRRQLMNHMMYSESRKAEELVTKLENRVGRLKKKSTREALAGEYLGAIDAILEQYEFRKVSGRKLDRRGALIAYINMMAEQGRENELAIPPEVIEAAQQTNYMELTVDHMQGVLDALVNIEHTARWKQKLRDKKAERDLNEVVDGVVDNIRANVRGTGRGRIATAADRRRASVRQYLNLVLNASTLLRKIDGFTDMGAAYRAVKEQIDLATRDLTERRAELAERIEGLYGVYSRSEQNQMAIKKENAAARTSMSKWDVISVALNMGNVDNLERLTDQNSQGFTRDQVDQIVAELDDRDWSFVQSMWDLIDSYWGEIAARERRLTGVAPKKVEAVPFETPNGRTMRGGYYPIMYDGELSAQVNTEQTEELMKNMQSGKFGKAQTANGHLKERKQGSGGRPLALGIEVAHRHLGRVIHDLAMSEAVNSSWRVLQHPKLRGAFADKGLLHDLETLELWVQDVAAGQLAAMDLPSRMFRRLKSNFTLAKLGFNMSTVLVQLTGLAQTAVVVGHKNFAMASIKYASNVPRAVADIEAKSQFMARRQTTFNKDINDILGDVTLGPLEAKWDKAMRKYAGPMAFWTMQKVQYYAVDVPTWIAAYDSGLRQGMTEAEAVASADATVVRAQAGGEFSDRSAFERGTVSRNSRQSDLIRLFTTLGSYMFAKFNVAYERTGRAQRVFRDEGFSARSVKEAASYAYDMAFLFVLEAMLYAAIMGRLPSDEDDEGAAEWAAFLARETAFGVAATLPFVRDVTGPMQGFAAGGAYGGITREIADVTVRPFIMLEDEEVSLAGVKALTRGVGLATGLPSTAVNRVIDGVWRESEGDDVALIEYLVGRR